MTYAALEDAARTRHLSVLGAFHPNEKDTAPEGCKTLVMLGPDEPRFWPAFTQSPECADGKPDPIDRWSTRVISALAAEIGAKPVFPFGGPPFLPFFTWATRTGRIHASPINFLVHDTAGLFVSFRGALALPERLALPPFPDSPCETCPDQPCRAACPVSALTPEGYDVAGCKAYLDTPPGADCMDHGCAARRACPVSQSFGRLPVQSAYHMAHFHRSAR
ncbi:ferredoxin [Sulfitobacter sp. TSTF-M16]|uniref:Ferredoxin n=1 Tax=Sulfitobacter aestuariivivens TaxID=2766981 RepID=A0A927D6W5_9RHOB|nr:ferredoxin [Sulfitobacter aestuariivivens]MBD3666034.1 ferredoxin [Sulfitobacter aestuariivivens]